MASIAGENGMSLISWILAGLGTSGVCWLAYRHWSRMNSLDSQLATGDPSLLKQSHVYIEEVIQAPGGSQLHEQQMVIAVKKP